MSGQGSDCTYDQQVPLDQNGYYTVVISKPEDRPKNANTVCGVKWLNFGPGEGPVEGSAPPNRSWEGVVYMRFMNALSGAQWPQSPKNIPQPTPENPNNELTNVMGEYAPVPTYTSQAAYEATGCGAGTPTLAAGSSTPSSGSFTLNWGAASNALPQLYALQHKRAGGNWATVASGLKSPEYTFPTGSPEGEGTWTYRVAAIDEGSSETEPEEGDFGQESEPVKVDRSGPNAPTAILSREPDYAGGGGWYRDSVIVSFSANADPALADGSEGAGIEPSSLTGPQTVEGSRSHTVCGTVADKVGNVSEPGCVTVQVDATPPSLTMSCPASTTLDSSGAAAMVSASDGQSGLASDPSGSMGISTGAVGAQTISATAVDHVGHETSGSCTTDVIYQFTKFRPSSGKRFKAGRNIAVKFHLASALGYYTSGSGILEIAPASGPEAGVYRAATSTSNNGDQFRREPKGLYSYSLATSGLSRGIWDLRVSLNDGTTHATSITIG